MSPFTKPLSPPKKYVQATFIIIAIALIFGWYYLPLPGKILGHSTLAQLRPSISHAVVHPLFYLCDLIIGLVLCLTGFLFQQYRQEKKTNKSDQILLQKEVQARTQALMTKINQLKEYEVKLRLSKNRYRALFHSQLDLICRYLPDGTLTFVNEAYCHFLNHPPDELLGKKHLLSIPPEEQGEIANLWAQLTPNTPVLSCEHRVVSSQGNILWQHWTTQALFDTEGNICEYQAVGRDISARIATQTALAESEKKFRALFESVNDAILLINLRV